MVLKDRVHVAGLGVISAIGNSVSETMDSFARESSGIGPLTLFGSVHGNTLPVGEVKLSNDTLAARLSLAPILTRTALLGVHAAREAVRDSGCSLDQWRTGLVSATTVGGMDKTEDFFIDFLQDPASGSLERVANHECGKSTELIATDLGINAFISTVNTACSSSVNAIMLGVRLIREGMLDVVIAGGTDALSRFTLNGFNSLMILDQQPCRPFDAERHGLNLGEGAGFVVLISEAVRNSGDLRTYGYVSGFSNTNDAYHQTASSPEGRGSFAAMEQAIAASGLSLRDIDYINLHGTGTLNNDLSEGTAVRRLFGDRVPKVSSTKAFTGHTLGASGGIEAVFSVLALHHRCVFPNLRFENPMPEIGIEPQITFEQNLAIRHVMSNSFGFGGNCSSIIFSKN
jgi:3-oxoacyl-(acyl-carrier-protein) synthase